MDGAEEGKSRKTKTRKERGKQPARKHLTNSRKLASVSALIRQLRQTVFRNPDTRATRRQVLNQTKNYILELENTLDNLLRMKDHIQPEDTSPCSLEDVKEEFLRIYFSDCSLVPDTEVKTESEFTDFWHLTGEYNGDIENMVEVGRTDRIQSPVSSSPELMEFERYLQFYKQTVDLLVENSIVSPELVTHPVVSKAISSLWQDLVQEGKTDMYQQCLQPAAPSLPYPKDSACADGNIRDSVADSQEASSSFLSSTPEEILFEDAFDIAAGFLDRSTVHGMSSPSSVNEVTQWESPEADSLLYQQIAGFLRTHLYSLPEDASLQCDYETILLRCTETFDDEDDF